jgi:membrane protease YdiL (CAAX protease family)
MTDQATRPSFVRRYPVASFTIMAMVLGGGTVYLLVRGILPQGLSLVPALSASIAGIIMTAVEDGRAGLELMLSRLLIWRVGIGYWLFAVLFVALAILLGSLLNPLFNGDALDFSSMGHPLKIIPIFFIFFIVAGLGEELGWTGFLMPRLQASHGALTSSIIRSVICGVWHLPLLIYLRLDHPSLADFPYSGWIAQMGLPVTIGVLTLLIILPWSVFYTWIFNNTRGSLLLVAVLHGSEIWVAYGMLNTGIDPRNFHNFWGYGAIIAVAAIIITLTNGAQDLSRKYKRIVRQPSPV